MAIFGEFAALSVIHIKVIYSEEMMLLLLFSVIKVIVMAEICYRR